MKKFFAFTIFLITTQSLSAQSLYFKDEEGKYFSKKFNFTFGDDDSLNIESMKLLEGIVDDPSKLPEGAIARREPSKAEKIVMASLILLFMIVGNDTYDIGPDLRLSVMRGLFLFFFPIDETFLYRRCTVDGVAHEYLIATTGKPGEATLKDMKTLEELQVLCHPPEEDKTDEEPKEPS